MIGCNLMPSTQVMLEKANSRAPWTTSSTVRATCMTASSPVAHFSMHGSPFGLTLISKKVDSNGEGMHPTAS